MTTDSVSGRSGALGAESMEKDKAVGVDKMTAIELYSYSTDEERYVGEYGSREEAAAAAFADTECEGCWTGRITPISLSRLLPSGYQIVDIMQDHAYDEVGLDASEDWLDSVTKDDEKELEKEVGAVIERWLERHKNLPRFWSVEDTQEHRRPSREAATLNPQESASPASPTIREASKRPEGATTEIQK